MIHINTHLGKWYAVVCVLLCSLQDVEETDPEWIEDTGILKKKARELPVTLAQFNKPLEKTGTKREVNFYSIFHFRQLQHIQ